MLFFNKNFIILVFKRSFKKMTDPSVITLLSSNRCFEGKYFKIKGNYNYFFKEFKISMNMQVMN